MKRAAVLGALWVGVVLAFGTTGAWAQDPTKVAPSMYKQIFENERVRVLQVVFEPGESIPVHSHPDHLAYAETAGKLRISPVGGSPSETDLTPGQVLFIKAESHSATNVGSTEIRVLVVELKEPAPVQPKAAPAKK